MTAAARRLLVLDDDALVGILLQTMAEGVGLEVRLTETPADFFAVLDEGWAPSHLVVDLTLGAHDGESVLQALAKRGTPGRILISSGADGDRLRAAEALARSGGLELAGALPKPFSAARLRALLG